MLKNEAACKPSWDVWEVVEYLANVLKTSGVIHCPFQEMNVEYCHAGMNFLHWSSSQKNVAFKECLLYWTLKIAALKMGLT